jgi:hypothetical protein
MTTDEDNRILRLRLAEPGNTDNGSDSLRIDTGDAEVVLTVNPKAGNHNGAGSRSDPVGCSTHDREYR